MINESKSQVSGNWFQIDFHVHSPASFDFEGVGKKTEEGYIWLLEQAKLSGLDNIVITDHNDIAGYFKLIEIEKDLYSAKRTLERTNELVPDTILSQIALFEQVNILPGVELDINPNIHFIILFDPERTDEISNFLSNAGYIPDVRGNEKSSTYCEWDVAAVLQEAEKINAIVIAAHTDSSKGLYEESKNWGRSRVSAFSNDNLYAMEFIKPVTRDQIEGIMKDTSKFTRKTRLAFVQSSDFHGRLGQKIGERRTYIRMDDINKRDKVSVFYALKKALRNPDEFVSAPERPELQVILRKLSEQPSIVDFQDENEKKRLIQYICAYANTEDGTIVIGKHSKGSWVGQPGNSEQELIDKITNFIQTEITPQLDFSLQIYPYYANKYIATVRVKKKLQIYSLKESDRVYIIESGQPKQTSTKEIVEIVENRLLDRYLHLSITNRLSDLSQKLLGAEDSIDILPIVRKIEKGSVLLKTALKSLKLGVAITDESILDHIQMDGNGATNGNIIVLSKESPRLLNQYLRVSAPIGLYNTEIASKQLLEMEKFHGKKIIIAPGGSVYYDNNDDIVVSCTIFPPLVFDDTNINYSASLKFVAAYLKSSTAIWYAERCLGSFDLRKSLIQNMPLPNKVSPDFERKIEGLLDMILSMEKEFLEAETNLIKEDNSLGTQQNYEFKDKRKNLAQNHNAKANVLMGEIDELFYRFFGLTNKEIHLVEQVMKSLGFAVFPRQDNHES